MKILVTNDDGIKCPNLKILVEHLTKYYDEIMVIAPTTEQSAVSHKINIANPITLIEHEDIIKKISEFDKNARKKIYSKRYRGILLYHLKSKNIIVIIYLFLLGK